MSKFATLFILTLLLLVSTRSFSARSGPAFPKDSPTIIQAKGIEMTDEAVEDSCDGIGEEECLMRRTLAAHVDYIYTQKHKP